MGIFCDSPLKEFGGFGQSFLVKFAPRVAALQVVLIRFGIRSGTLDDAFFVFTRQADSQRRRDFFGNLTLELENVRCLSAVLLAPNLAVIPSVYQLGADVQIIAALRDPAL